MVRPKIVASTATVRRARDQIRALFARPLTQIFPPPGPDRRNSFFARTLPIKRNPRPPLPWLPRKVVTRSRNAARYGLLSWRRPSVHTPTPAATGIHIIQRTPT